MVPFTSIANATIFLPAWSSALAIHDFGIVTALLCPSFRMLLIIGIFTSPFCVIMHNVYILY